MAKKQPEAVSLDRGTDTPRRRIPIWAIVLIVILLLVGVVVIYTFWFQISGLMGDVFARETPLPQPTGDASGMLYQANFDSDVSADWEAVFDNGRVSSRFDPGMLVINVNSPNDEGSWLAMNLSFEDFVLDVDATKIAGPDDQSAIVLFRLQDNSNYYRFDVNFDGYYSLSKAVGGNLAVISAFNASDAITKGSVTNHIQIWGQGNVFRFFVNGTQLPLCVSTDPNVQPIWDTNMTPAGCLGGQVVQEWTDTAFAQGKIGLGAQGLIGLDEDLNTIPAQATIGFDNLTIRTPEAAGQP